MSDDVDTKIPRLCGLVMATVFNVNRYALEAFAMCVFDAASDGKRTRGGHQFRGGAELTFAICKLDEERVGK